MGSHIPCFTGLFTSLCVALSLCDWTQHVLYLLRLLLDNVPSSLQTPLIGIWVTLLLLVSFFISWTRPRTLPHHQLTVTRSQVRGVRTLIRRSVVILLFYAWTDWIHFSLRGEGCVRVMADTRAGMEPAKPHDEELRMALEPFQPFRRNFKIQKRSYRRALQRVQTHGFTWYRGRLISGNISSNIPDSPPPSGKSQNVKPPGSKRRTRLSCLSWNAGGMSTTDWDHFQIWICK